MASEEERARGKGGVGGREGGREGGGERERGRQGGREGERGGTLASGLLGFWLLLPGKEKLATKLLV